MTVEEDPASEADTQDFEVTLPADLSSVARARRFIEQRCSESGSSVDDDVLADVELIVSELVANAVRHGQPDIIFRFRCDPMSIDVAVLDHGPGMPRKPNEPAPTHAQNGRGLLLVDHLAQRWGVTPHEGQSGKTVWASISRDS